MKDTLYKSEKLKLNDKLQPINAPIANREKKLNSLEVDYRNERGAITEALIQDRTITSDKLVDELNLGTINNAYLGTPFVLGGTLDNSTLGTVLLIAGTIRNGIIGTPSITSGTATNTVLNNNVIGTPNITGGTATTTVLNTNTIGTPMITGGTVNAITIGTPALVGGTLDPSVYKVLGTAGATGTIDLATTGTIFVKNGIIVGIS